MAGTAAAGDVLLFERETQLEAVEACLESARTAKRGSLTLIEGEAGIGKSSLLRAAVSRSRESGMRVLGARSGPAERDFPFGVALQLFESSLREADGEERASMLSGAASLCTPLFDGIGDSRTQVADEQALFPLLHGLYWLTANLAELGPVTLSLDDAHWSDESSLRFLDYLIQRLEGLPVAVLLAVRTGEPGLGQELQSILRHPYATVLRPTPLSASAVAAIVERARPTAAPAELAEACAEVTGGNPFLLHELLTALDQDSQGPSTVSAEELREMAPESVRRAVLVRLARLPVECVALAQAVSVLTAIGRSSPDQSHDDASLPGASRLADLDTDLAARAADKLVAARILAPGEPLRFAHPIVRAAVYGDLAPGERGLAHRRAARQILDARFSPERAAPHLLRASTAGEDWAVEALRAAAARASDRGAAETAIRYLRRALAEGPGGDLRAEVLLDLGRAGAIVGDADAGRCLEDALELIDDPRRRAATLLSLGRGLYTRGDFRRAVDAFERGETELGDVDAALARELEAAYITVGRFVPELRAEVGARLERRLRRPPDGDDRSQRSMLAELALHQAWTSQPRDKVMPLALRAWSEGQLLAEDSADGTAVYAVTGALLACDELELELVVLDAALADARRRGSLMALATAGYRRALVLGRLCRIPEAIAEAEQVAEVRRRGWQMLLPVALAAHALALLERDVEAAAAVLTLPDEERWSEVLPYAMFLDARAQVQLALRDGAGALETATAVASMAAPMLPNVSAAMVGWRVTATLAAARVGDLDRARETSDEDLTLARRCGVARSLGTALRARALVEGGEAGLARLQEAVDVLEGSQSRLELARALADLGAALRRAGQRRAAREPLRRALEIAAHGGATLLAASARDELVAAGAKPRRTALSGASALTPAELRVAKLAADGLTNREIAEALFVTRKTVDWHLRHIFQKLDIASRRELSDALEAEQAA